MGLAGLPASDDAWFPSILESARPASPRISPLPGKQTASSSSPCPGTGNFF